MADTKYQYGKGKGIHYKNGNDELFVDISKIKEALAICNEKIKTIDTAVPELFPILGMRNLSAFVGELFAKSLEQATDKLLIKNPHQDGYPDLLAMTEEGKKAWHDLRNNLQDKKPFSPFISGGLEVKATCGAVPTPAVLAKKGLRRPDIGDTRIEFSTGYDWKAHHRLTNNLLGLVWDFIDAKPIIVAVFYSSDLKEEDWGTIVQPKEGGGRTTSVSIMTRGGILKMYQGWLAVIDDRKYIDYFNKFNKSNLVALQQEGDAVPVSLEASE
jgi:hypothetical protein